MIWYYVKFLLTKEEKNSIVLLVFSRTQNARVAQLVERDLAKVEAAGSSPVSRFFVAQKSGRLHLETPSGFLHF